MSVFRTAGGRWRLPGRRRAAVAACMLAAAGLTGGAVLASAGPAAAAPAATPPAVTATIPVGTAPAGVAAAALAGTVYVANSGSDTVSVISGQTNTVTATIGVGSGPEWVPVIVVVHAEKVITDTVLLPALAT